MDTRELRARVAGGKLVGWVRGEGPRLLLLHGGPGMAYSYLDDMADDIGDGYTIASYQQRGLAPSTTEGPFDVGTQIDDVAHVLDALGWDKAYVVGHSWGGHLAMHVATRLGDRLDGVLCVDPLGAVGDGQMAAFEAAMSARTPEADRLRATELDERAMRGEGTEEDALESLRLVWPAYFADPATAPPMPPMRLAVQSYAETFASIVAELPALAAALPSIRVPVGFLAGGASPMPAAACTDAAAVIPSAWVETVPAAGHFPWHEAPGCARAAVQRLVAS
ncbi:MAG: alpha/beta hydrolase [Frankiales bacterium]|nr:alpha/beta hydrolase [Frankiales bacterium]